MDIVELQTERLTLRAPAADDYPVYRDFFADPSASAFYGGPLDAGQAWRVLATDLGHWALRGFGRWSAIERASGAMVGGCGLWWPQTWPRSELTWWIVPEARRRGYALEASRAVIAYALDALGWPHVETYMNDENEAARQLAIKLGGVVIAREVFPDGLTRSIYQLTR